MMVFILIWYGLRLVLYPVRLVLYTVHSFLIFLSKPGARFLIPALLAAAALWQHAIVSALADPLVTEAVSILQPLDAELHAMAFPYRFWIVGTVGLIVGIILINWLSKLIRPVIGALPAPSPPMLPRMALRVRTFRLKTARSKLVVRPRGGNRRRLSLQPLIARLDPDVRAVFEQSGQAQLRYAALMQGAEARPQDAASPRPTVEPAPVAMPEEQAAQRPRRPAEPSTAAPTPPQRPPPRRPKRSAVTEATRQRSKRTWHR